MENNKNCIMLEDNRNEFVDIEPYLIQETKELLKEIESKNQFEVKLRKVYDNLESWQIRKFITYHIDMPSWDEGNVVNFTHELLHIYFNHVLGNDITFMLPILVNPYSNNEINTKNLLEYYVNLTNNLQHHKMVPFFSKFNLPLNKIVNNYENPIKIFETFDLGIKEEFDFSNPSNKYASARFYVNFLALELYFPNHLIRLKLKSLYSKEFDNKFFGLRSIFQPVLEKWDSEYNDTYQLIIDINEIVKEYAESK